MYQPTVSILKEVCPMTTATILLIASKLLTVLVDVLKAKLAPKIVMTPGHADGHIIMTKGGLADDDDDYFNSGDGVIFSSVNVKMDMVYCRKRSCKIL